MKKLTYLTVLVLALSACDNSDKPNVELIQDMMVSPAYKAQDAKSSEGGTTMLLPPENTLPIGHKRYPFAPGEMDKAGRRLANPIAGKMTVEILDRGKDRYEIYCGVCHGMKGAGDSPVAEKMPVRPPSLVNATVKGYRDGKLYHIIMHGKGVMGSYANQLHNDKDRWAVVNYLRNLQKLAN